MKLKKGSISKRKDGRWECKLYVEGKQITTACCSLQKDAIAKHDEYLKILAKNKGKPLQPEKRVSEYLSSWLLRWLDTYKRGKIQSWQNIERTINLHILPVCPEILLAAVTEYQLVEIINKGKSARIAVDCYKILKECLHKAYINRLINFDVAATLTKPSYTQAEGRAYSADELAELRQKMSDTSYGVLIEWYLVTGCRPRELFSIRLPDINLAQGYIRIRGTKNKTSDRTVPIFERTRKLLANINHTDKYITWELTYEGLKSAIGRCNEQYGTTYKIKDLRTTFATDCASKGIAPKVLSKWLGHAKTETTNQYYIKVLPEFEQGEIYKFDN